MNQIEQIQMLNAKVAELEMKLAQLLTCFECGCDESMHFRGAGCKECGSCGHFIPTVLDD